MQPEKTLAAFPAFNADFATADIYDSAPERVEQIDLSLRHFGGRRKFAGLCSTLRATDNPQAIADAVREEGRGRVLVIDGRAVPDCASFGEIMATRAREAGWAGVVVVGAIRDTGPIAAMDLGVMALRTTAKRPFGTGETGVRDVPVEVGGTTVVAGAALYADEDALIQIAPQEGGK